MIFCRRPVWLAWYPKRGLRCTFSFTRHCEPRFDWCNTGWNLTVAIGPALASLGPGTPSP